MKVLRILSFADLYEVLVTLSTRFSSKLPRDKRFRISVIVGQESFYCSVHISVTGQENILKLLGCVRLAENGLEKGNSFLVGGGHCVLLSSSFAALSLLNGATLYRGSYCFFVVLCALCNDPWRPCCLWLFSTISTLARLEEPRGPRGSLPFGLRNGCGDKHTQNPHAQPLRCVFEVTELFADFCSGSLWLGIAWDNEKISLHSVQERHTSFKLDYPPKCKNA
mmetsp:Transcript_49014/g.90835  ORF Transcript_49014/g.90835 Transcript_49014/m.90835 type:complete len:223 (-) Transcript_49014:167-835(-)